MFERGLARRVAVIGVGHDCADEFFGVAAFAKDFGAFCGMFAISGVVSVGPAFVIEIVKEGCEAPEFFIGAGFAGVGADAGFYGEHVFAQGFGLRVFADKIPGVFAGWQEKFLRSNFGHSLEHSRGRFKRATGEYSVRPPARFPRAIPGNSVSSQEFCCASTGTPVQIAKADVHIAEKSAPAYS